MIWRESGHCRQSSHACRVQKTKRTSLCGRKPLFTSSKPTPHDTLPTHILGGQTTHFLVSTFSAKWTNQLCANLASLLYGQKAVLYLWFIWFMKGPRLFSLKQSSSLGMHWLFPVFPFQWCVNRPVQIYVAWMDNSQWRTDFVVNDNWK